MCERLDFKWEPAVRSNAQITVFGFLEGRFVIKVFCFWMLNVLWGLRDSLLSADKQHSQQQKVNWGRGGNDSSPLAPMFSTACRPWRPMPRAGLISGHLHVKSSVWFDGIKRSARIEKRVSRNPVWGLAADKSTNQRRSSDYQRPQIFITQAWKDTNAQSCCGTILNPISNKNKKK